MNKLLDNLEGQRFGEWLVIHKTKPNTYGNTYWWVRCSCGKEREISGRSLRYYKSTHCGCKRTKKLTLRPIEHKKFKFHHAFKDISEQTFGNLVAIKPIKQNAKGEWYWLCQCSCGNETEVRGSHLRGGTVQSCGCEMYISSANSNVSHGLTYTKSYTNYRNRGRKQKSRDLDANWTPEKEQFLRNLFQQCVLCAITEDEHFEKYGTSLHIDHVRPLKHGNGLDVGNATVLCAKCNQFKHAKQLEDLPEHIHDRLIVTSDLFQLLWNGIV